MSFRERGRLTDAPRERSSITSQAQTRMTYIEQFATEYAKMLDESKDAAAVVSWVSERILRDLREEDTAGQKETTKDPA